MTAATSDARVVHAGRLRAAVTAGDTAAARSALWDLIGLTPGGWPGKMEAQKATRAEAFEVAGRHVRFTIERHPGLSWLTHRTQTWEVDTATGKATSTECVKQLTVDDLLVMARSPAPVVSKVRDGQWLAARALEYGMRHGAEPEHTAIGWVALMLPAVGRWPGHLDDMVSALCEGGHLSRQDALPIARAVSVEARALWSRCLKAQKGARS